MGTKVVLEEEESIDSALLRLRHQQVYEYKRWTKKRYWYYEKPSELKRKRKKMAELWQVSHGPHAGASCQARLHLYIGLEALFSRSGPSNSAGK
ncbi:MAG: hypothetical protein K0R03_2399 [Moraxellaceae bacterium]|jgi:ribosomal protein S21|nr:hypothetical protein [Moraxellaceae bacterium]